MPRGERLNLELADGRTLSAIRYAPADDGDAPPVVTFLHGVGLNAHTWDAVILALGVPALAIDLPGHGDSSWRDDARYVARTLAPDVIVGMRAWTDRPQLLVGHSLGGLTGAAVAASAPDLVTELVVLDITPGIDPNGGAAELGAFFAGATDWASRDELVQRALDFGLGGGDRRVVERGVYFNSRVRADGRVEWKHHFAHLAAAAANAAAAGSPAPGAVAAVVDGTEWDDFARVNVPITLIRAENGFLTDTDAAAFHSRLPGATIQTLPRGHNIQEERPLLLADRLRPLL